MAHYAHIENEAAYERAIDRRIKANRAKTGRAKWLAAHEDAQTLHNWLFGAGEFSSQNWVLDPLCYLDENGFPEHRFEVDGQDYRCKCKRVDHPLSFYARGDFLGKMRMAIDEWGGLTDGQHAAVAKSYANAQEKLAGRDTARAAENAADALTSHVGTVGERRDFVLTVERVMSFDGHYGTSYINVCRDADRNIVVYKGSNGWTRGDVITCKATIKAHDLRDGIPQTIISRPKV